MSVAGYINPLTKELIITEAKRVIEILQDPKVDLNDCWGSYCARSEVRNKMKELRRDTIRLDKEMYPRY